MKLSSKSLIIMILVLLTTTTVALAQQNSQRWGKGIMLKGQVTEVDENSLTLSLSSEESVTVTVNDQTRIGLSTKQTEGRLADIQVGNKVYIHGRQTNEDSVEARLILVMPSQFKSRIRIRSQVTAINDNSFTLHSRRGDYTVLTDGSTQYQARSKHKEADNGLEVGSKVLVRGTQVQGQANTIQAKLIRYLRQRSK